MSSERCGLKLGSIYEMLLCYYFGLNLHHRTESSSLYDFIKTATVTFGARGNARFPQGYPTSKYLDSEDMIFGVEKNPAHFLTFSPFFQSLPKMEKSRIWQNRLVT